MSPKSGSGFGRTTCIKNKAGDRSFSRKTGVPPIAGTLCKTIQADLERWSRLTLS